MSKGGLIILCGVVVLALPFLGIPALVKTVLFVIAGIAGIVLGLLVREERKWMMRALYGDHQKDAYTENGAHSYAEREAS